MIIGETINSGYDGYEEENYDYLFKRKSKEERQQKKTVRQEKRAEKKQVKQVKRQEKKATKAATPKKHPILGNFGLFNKNKKKEAAAAKTAGSSGASGSSGKNEADSDSGSTSGGEGNQSGSGLTALAAGAAGLLDKSKGGNDPASESAGEGNEGAKSESKELDANGNPKKQAGMGAMFGFVCLGVVILVVGVAIYKADKKPISELQPLRAAA
ncbi:MAG: hypothetical protein HYU69_12005 [Bacteroidetes bacterium]|nr:hypothetical protein [Bacteroidota bacterium]